MKKKPFVVVLEGPKGIGKSTLTQKLLKQIRKLGYSVTQIHLTKETGGNYEGILQMLTESTYDVVILDRLHISEVVYTEATEGRRLRFSREQLEEMTRNVDFTILLNASDATVVLDRIIARDAGISELDRTILSATVEGFKRVSDEHPYLLSERHIITCGYEALANIKEQQAVIKQELLKALEG